MNAFDQIVGTVIGLHERVDITPQQFREFDEQHWTIYILQDKRYGQAFCEHFGLSKLSTLYHFKDEKVCRRWIRDNYGVGNETEIH